MRGCGESYNASNLEPEGRKNTHPIVLAIIRTGHGQCDNVVSSHGRSCDQEGKRGKCEAHSEYGEGNVY